MLQCSRMLKVCAFKQIVPLHLWAQHSLHWLKYSIEYYTMVKTNGYICWCQCLWSVLLNIMIQGLQCLDWRIVWLLMGHDGAFLEHSTREGQSSGSNIWRGHLCKAHGKSGVLCCDSVTGITRLLLHEHPFLTQPPTHFTTNSFWFTATFSIFFIHSVHVVGGVFMWVV